MRRCARPGLQRHVRFLARAAAAPQSRPGHHVHLVVHRDTLGTVAATYDVPLHALVAVNEHLTTSQTLLPGTLVVIPRLRQDKPRQAAGQRRASVKAAVGAPVKGDGRVAGRRQQQGAAHASGAVTAESVFDPLVALLALGKSDQTAARQPRSSRAPTPAVPVTRRTVAVPEALAFVPATGPSLQLCGAVVLLALVATTADRVRMGRRRNLGAGGEAGAGVPSSVEASGVPRLLAPPAAAAAAVVTRTDAGAVEAPAMAGEPAEAAAVEDAVPTPADAARRQRSTARGLSRKTPASVSRSRAMHRLGDALAAKMSPAQPAMQSDFGLPDADSALEELWSAGEAADDLDDAEVGEEEEEYESDLDVLAEELAMMEPFVLEVPPGWAPRVVDIVEPAEAAARETVFASIIAANLALIGMLALLK